MVIKDKQKSSNFFDTTIPKKKEETTREENPGLNFFSSNKKKEKTKTQTIKEERPSLEELKGFSNYKRKKKKSDIGDEVTDILGGFGKFLSRNIMFIMFLPIIYLVYVTVFGEVYDLIIKDTTTQAVNTNITTGLEFVNILDNEMLSALKIAFFVLSVLIVWTCTRSALRRGWL